MSLLLPLRYLSRRRLRREAETARSADVVRQTRLDSEHEQLRVDVAANVARIVFR